MKKWTIFNVDTEFNFGKHKGKNLNEVANKDFSYIVWCTRKIDKFLISEENLRAYSLAAKNSLLSIFSSPNEEFMKNSVLFLVSEIDLVTLKKKWVEYENHIDMMENSNFEHNNDYSIDNNPYYNDNLDLDQQDPEFWDFF